MKYRIVILILCLLVFAGCSSSDTSSSGTSTTLVSSAQVKALAKVNNIKTKHTSTNGASGFGVFSMLPSSIGAMETEAEKCKKHKFSKDFDSAAKTEEAVPNCTTKALDLKSFGSDDITGFTPGAITVSERTLDDGSKKYMAIYRNNLSNSNSCTGTGDSLCQTVYFTDGSFYKDDYYTGTKKISTNGTFQFEEYNSSTIRFTIYTWDASTHNVNMTDIHKPSIPTNNTYLKMGTKSAPCKILDRPSDEYCLFHVGVNVDDKVYKFLGELEMSDSKPRSDGPPVGEDENLMIMDLFYYDNEAWDKATDKDAYFKTTVKKLCPSHVATSDAKPELFFMNKIGYLSVNMTNGEFSIKDLSSTFTANKNTFVDLKTADNEIPKVSQLKEGSTTEYAVKGTDCDRMN